jgi:hypothetical protein
MMAVDRFKLLLLAREGGAAENLAGSRAARAYRFNKSIAISELLTEQFCTLTETFKFTQT